MAFLNVEIKAKCSDQDHIRRILKKNNADFRGVDHQVDTYFRVPNGRLKLREGNIENNLIHYFRKDTGGPRESEVTLYRCTANPEADVQASESAKPRARFANQRTEHVDPKPATGLRETLTNALGVLTVVDKKREIYFINNVKFHIDMVKGLGGFVEIEAIDADGTIGREELQSQCEYYIRLLEISGEDMISTSYSDMLLDSA